MTVQEAILSKETNITVFTTDEFMDVCNRPKTEILINGFRRANKGERALWVFSVSYPEPTQAKLFDL